MKVVKAAAVQLSVALLTLKFTAARDECPPSGR